MSPRDTSADAYAYIVRTGILGARREEAYSLLYLHGPLTAGELQAVRGATPGIWKRLSELRTMGVAREVGERPCRITRREAIVWDVTAIRPSHPYRKDQKPEKLGRTRDCVKLVEALAYSNEPCACKAPDLFNREGITCVKCRARAALGKPPARSTTT